MPDIGFGLDPVAVWFVVAVVVLLIGLLVVLAWNDGRRR